MRSQSRCSPMRITQRRHRGFVAGVPDLEADCAHALPNALCRAEEPGGFAVTAGVAGQSGEAFEDVGNAQVRLDFGGDARARRGRRARPAPAHPARSPRGRASSAPTSGTSRSLSTTASSAQRRAATRSPPPARPGHSRRAAMPPCHALTTLMSLPGRLARLVRRRDIAGGQGRDSQRRVGRARVPSAKLRGGLEGRVGRGSGRGRLTLVRQCHALTSEADHPAASHREPPRPRRPPRRIVRRLRPDRPEQLCHPEVKATQARVEPVTDRVGEVASFFGGRAQPRSGHPRRGAASPARRGSG